MTTGSPEVVVSVVFHSSYRGATAALARAEARGAEMVDGVDATLIPVEEVDDHWGRLHASDAVVFGTPTYVGSMAARFKVFVEQLAGEVFLDRLWTGKVAGGFTVSAGRSGDKLNTLTDLVVVAGQMGMTWVPVPITGGNYSSKGGEDDLNRMAGYLGVMAQANIDEPSDLAPPPSDILTAELHGRHIATTARYLALGRGDGRPAHGTPTLSPSPPPWTLRDMEMP